MTKLDLITTNSNRSSSEVSYEVQLVQLSIAHEEQRNALQAANQELRKKITRIERNHSVKLEKQKKKLNQDIDNLKKKHSKVQEDCRKIREKLHNDIELLKKESDESRQALENQICILHEQIKQVTFQASKADFFEQEYKEIVDKHNELVDTNNLLIKSHQHLQAHYKEAQCNYKCEIEKNKVLDGDLKVERQKSGEEIKRLQKLNFDLGEHFYSMRKGKRQQELKYKNLQNQFAVFKTLHNSKIRQLIRNPEIFSVNRSKQLTENRIKEQKYFDERQKETTMVMTGLYAALVGLMGRIKKIHVLKETMNSWMARGYRQIFEHGSLCQTFNTLSVIHNDDKFAQEFQKLQEAMSAP